MNDFSVQPVKEHLLELAEIRLRNHPGMFQMLKHKLATGSPRALMILDCLVPGEWVYSLKASRDFSSIDAKLIRAIDSWVNSRPTSKTVVVPLPAPYLPAGEPLAAVSDAPDQEPATVNQVQASQVDLGLVSWTLKKPPHFKNYNEAVYKYLKAAVDEKTPNRPTASDMVDSWHKAPVAPIIGIAEGIASYVNSKGVPVDIGKTPIDTLENIRKVIGRMTTKNKP